MKLAALRRSKQIPPWLPAGTTLIEARGVTVRLGGWPILRSVDVAAAAGELVVLVGPNGAGKSTLFGALSGEVAPASGEVRLWGRPLSGWSTAEMALRRAVLPQRVEVSFPFTVRDIVEMGRAPWFGTARAEEEDAAVAEALSLADVASLHKRQFPSLSGGERARVAFARVLAQGCQLMLLDEPTAALDLHHQELVLQVVRERVRRGYGAVVVLHNLELAAAYAHRIVVLSRGTVAGDGRPEEVLTANALSTVYQHPVDVFPHPSSGSPIVLPARDRAAG